MKQAFDAQEKELHSARLMLARRQELLEREDAREELQRLKVKMEALAKEHASALYKLSMAEEKTRLAQSTEEEFRALAAKKDAQLRKCELELEERGKQHGVLELELERCR